MSLACGALAFVVRRVRARPPVRGASPPPLPSARLQSILALLGRSFRRMAVMFGVAVVLHLVCVHRSAHAVPTSRARQPARRRFHGSRRMQSHHMRSQSRYSIALLGYLAGAACVLVVSRFAMTPPLVGLVVLLATFQHLAFVRYTHTTRAYHQVGAGPREDGFESSSAGELDKVAAHSPFVPLPGTV